ncbi:MAG: PEP-CTERM sorting domain-containing protein [Bythopirellula sp.]|nr:PEP-CTERM sorting domain-containing protein [Bythopirellula sp.]
MTRKTCLPALLLSVCCLLNFTQMARAGYSVEISVDFGAPVIYVDNGAFDLNPAVFDMEFDFTVNDVGNNWTASGTVLATGGGDGVPPVSTIVTDTLIQKLLPGLFFGNIEVTHNYAASGLLSHSAVLDGQFENVLGNPISYAELFYTPRVYPENFGMTMGTAHEGPVSGVLGPVPFDELLGPIVLPTTIEHEITLGFYLDAPGDAIRLFNSAEIHTIVPEPTSAVLFLTAIVGFVGRWRK